MLEPETLTGQELRRAASAAARVSPWRWASVTAQQARTACLICPLISSAADKAALQKRHSPPFPQPSLCRVVRPP